MHRLTIGFMHVENGIFPALSIPKDNQLKHFSVRLTTIYYPAMLFYCQFLGVIYSFTADEPIPPEDRGGSPPRAYAEVPTLLGLGRGHFV